MEKKVEIGILCEYYKDILTPKQADAIDLYYNNDLSLAEIANVLNISRQGVLDFIRKGEKTLYKLENSLKLMERNGILQDMLTKLKLSAASAKRDIMNSHNIPQTIKNAVDDILLITTDIENIFE